MKKENTKEAIAKKKKRTKIACYIGLVVLAIMIAVPPLLRKYVPDTSDENKKELLVINCNKANESLNSSFVNGKPQNILYSVKGNIYEENNPDEEMGLIDNENNNDALSENTSQDNEDMSSLDSSIDNTTIDEQNSIVDDNISSNENEIENDTNINFNTKEKPPLEPKNIEDKELYQLIIDYSTIDYDQASNVTSISVHVPDLSILNQYNEIFGTSVAQEKYFSSTNIIS